MDNRLGDGGGDLGTERKNYNTVSLVKLLEGDGLEDLDPTAAITQIDHKE